MSVTLMGVLDDIGEPSGGGATGSRGALLEYRGDRKENPKRGAKGWGRLRLRGWIPTLCSAS